MNSSNSYPSVLHIAPENTAGVPFNVTNMQNKFGMPARLITFYKIPYDFPEDICLNLPLPRSKAAMKWREIKQSMLKSKINQKNFDPWTFLPYFEPKNSAEKAYMKLRENKNKNKFLNALNQINADSFDIIHYDGGIDFFYDSKLAKAFKLKGKKIVNCYFGDDLRTRGIVREMDEISDLNLTFEYDHTLRHPNINFLFFPFDNSVIPFADNNTFEDSFKNKIKIVHSPTQRIVKGTPEIISAVNKVIANRNAELVLLENMPRSDVLKIKQSCHIAIDQIGNRGGTGYGINSLETLSMGLFTVTDMNCNMDKWLPENPFFVADKNNLYDVIINIIDNFQNLINKRDELRNWVIKYHSYKSVFDKLIQYYKSADIL